MGLSLCLSVAWVDTWKGELTRYDMSGECWKLLQEICLSKPIRMRAHTYSSTLLSLTENCQRLNVSVLRMYSDCIYTRIPTTPLAHLNTPLLWAGRQIKG